MKSPLFIDTSFIVALFNRRDKYHRAAQRAAAALNDPRRPKFTTEAVITEVGNAMSSAPYRAGAVAIIDSLRSNPTLEVISVSPALFNQAYTLYAARLDKDWGLTDCISFVVMQQRGIIDALTVDRHFEQAGFRVGMIEDRP